MTSAERNIKVYCPAHKTHFEVQTVGRVVCASDPHLLATDFPRESFWEYCCDCQRFWPSDLNQGGQGAAACAACHRLVARRYLCGHCKVLSVDSDDAGSKRKFYTVGAGGVVSPACPGCGSATEGVTARPHECGAALTSFHTARVSCPFCEEPLEVAAQQRAAEHGGLDFPAWVTDCLQDAPGRTSTPVRPDLLKDMLVKDPEGRGQLMLVHDWGVPGGQLYLVPRVTRFQMVQEFHSYYDRFYNCTRPSAGEVCVNKPALVKRVPGGWRLLEKGELEVDPVRAPPPARVQPKQPEAPKQPDAARAHAAQPATEAKASSQPAPTVKPAAPARSPETESRQGRRTAEAVAAPVRTYPAATPSTAQTAGRGDGGRRSLMIALGVLAAVVGGGLLIVAIGSRRPSNLNVGSNTSTSSTSGVAVPNSNVAATPAAGGAEGAAAANNFSPTNLPPGMVYVPGGSFLMGGGDDPYERPAHGASVGAFFIDTYEVTCAEYEKFAAATGHKTPDSWGGKTCPSGWAQLPVTGVSWDDAQAYAAWAGKRLPTEAEWEFAARGTDGRKYPWGDQWEAGASNVKGTAGQLAEVGAYRSPSPFGVYDMSGNAWEWTATDFAIYPGGEAVLAKNQRPGKVIRGGCYASTTGQATTTYRGVWPPRGENYDRTGFRCVLDVP